MAGQLFVLLGFEIPAAHRFIFTKSIKHADAFSTLTDKKLAHLIVVTHKHAGRVTGVSVTALAKWNFNLPVWLAKIQTMCSRPVYLGAITPQDLTLYEDLSQALVTMTN